jgi:hypothetical protein
MTQCINPYYWQKLPSLLRGYRFLQSSSEAVTVIIIMKHYGCVMAQVVDHQSFTTKTQFQNQSSPCKICGELENEGALGQVFLRILQFSHVSIISVTFHTHIQLSYHQCTILAMESTVKKHN